VVAVDQQAAETEETVDQQVAETEETQETEDKEEA